MKNKEIGVIEYTRDKKIADPNSLVLDGDSEVETAIPTKQESPSSIGDFSWHKNQDLIVVHHQPAIAVHRHPDGSICIRQDGFLNDRDDVVYFAPEHAEKIANTILAVAKGTE